MTNPPPSNVLVIGAYGLIGRSVTTALQARGDTVTGLGRNRETARRVLPGISWLIYDVQTLATPADWVPLLAGITHVVNCSGVLQEGPQDKLERIHVTCVDALAQACAKCDIPLVQISAIGAHLEAETAFLSTKARGDAAIAQAGGRFSILRPGLVLAPQAYGGSAMLRMLAAFPIVQPIAMADARVQTIAASDLAQAVCAAIDGLLPAGLTLDLVEEETHTLRQVLVQIRQWLGFAPGKAHIPCPDWAMYIIAWGADCIGQLGWRSPLRSTAITTLKRGVTGHYVDIRQYGLPAVQTLSQTLRALPATTQDRVAARLALGLPIMVITLCIFWLYSGVIGFLEYRAAAQVLTNVGWSEDIAQASVWGWSIVDIAIGLGFAVRRFAKAACLAAVVVSAIYLVSSSMFVPSLWLDPLGPLAKIVPAMVLALVTRAALEDR